MAKISSLRWRMHVTMKKLKNALFSSADVLKI